MAFHRLYHIAHECRALTVAGMVSVAACAGTLPAGRAAETTTAAPHHSAASGIKHELIAGITAADFLRIGEKPKTVKLTVVAVFTDANYGMNFNGYAHGKAGYTVPTGWTVEVTFINPSPVPHSLIVVERDTVKKLQMGSPIFPGASVPNPTQGLSGAKATFTFVADEPGDYALACGFPTHAINGHWIGFNVREDAKAPVLDFPPAAAQTTK